MQGQGTATATAEDEGTSLATETGFGGTAIATAPAANRENATKAVLSDEFWLKDGFDPRRRHKPWEERRATGKAVRSKIPLKVHGEWRPEPDRPDPVETIFATNAGRQQELIPLRLARMTASAFTFYRGAASIMAWDLSRTPTTGFPVVMGGDSHLNNFGLYATPQREVVFDMNDFDEVVIGPWEWDLKRLAASVNIAGRENGLSKRERRRAVGMCVRGYYETATMHQDLGIAETWSRHTYAERLLAKKELCKRWDLDPKALDRTLEVWKGAVEKAKRNTNETLLGKAARIDEKGKYTFAYDPPVLSKVSRTDAKKVTDSLVEYAETLARDRRLMFRRYHVVDVAHRVVGVGSVGIRAYLVMMFGNGPTDPLFLQVKEATEPAHAPFLPNLLDERHPGWRVVTGQRVVQASTDFMLGWTTIDGRPFYVRQMRNFKASIPTELLSGGALGVYALACGGVLARGHARTGDIAKIAGYLGKSTKFENAMADFAEAYADQNEKDHAAFSAAVAAGRI